MNITRDGIKKFMRVVLEASILAVCMLLAVTSVASIPAGWVALCP